MNLNEFNVISTIDKAITKDPLLKDFRSRSLYPSSASVVTKTGAVLGSCIRAEWFRLTDIENIKPYNDMIFSSSATTLYEEATQQYIFASGNMWESFVVELLKLSDCEVQHHVRWQNPKFHVSGELDIVVKPKGWEKPFIVEMKTTSGYFNEKKIFKGGIPKDQNLLQCALYAHHFRNETCGVKLVYIDRGELSNRTEFNIEYHEETKKVNGKDAKFAYIKVNGELITDWSINGIYARFKQLWDHYEQLTIPKCDFIPTYTEEQLNQKIRSGEITKSHQDKIKSKAISGDYPCHYCKYKNICEAINTNNLNKEQLIEAIARHRSKYYNL